MNKFLKIISFVLSLFLIVSLVACTGEEAEKNQETSQKVYNTIFKTATTVEPNSTTAITEEQTEETESTTTTVTTTVVEETSLEETQSESVSTTTKREGKRPVFEQTHDMRKISSEQLLSQLGSGITLGDSFTARGLESDSEIADYETFFNNPVVAMELIVAYKSAGFDIVRIPVCWSDHIDENGVVDASWLDRIQEVVDYCFDNDLYCIINSQNDQNWLTTSSVKFNKTKAKFSQMWTDIANRFKGYDDRLLFEGMAEVLKAENDKSAPSKSDYKNANFLNQAFVDAVRKTGGNNAKRHLIVSTYGAFIDSASLDGFSVPKDSKKNKLIAKVNVFVPSSFCFDESADNMWGSSEDKTYIDSVFYAINQRFSELKIPVIIGEFGAVEKGNASARAAYAKYVVSTAYNYYMVCFWNDNGQNMKLFDRTNFGVLSTNIVDAIVKTIG